MRHAIISDIHSRSAAPLNEFLREQNADTLWCLGDYDNTECIEEFINLYHNLEKQGVTTYLVAGNHDTCHYRCSGIESKELSREEFLINAIMNIAHQRVNRFLDDLCNKPATLEAEIETPFGNLSTVALHGAFTGTYEALNNRKDSLRWNRIRSFDTARKNFDKMKEKGYDLMLRGHDHCPRVIFQSPEGILGEYDLDIKPNVPLQKGHRYIINPGAYCDGNIVILDTDKPQVEYKEVKVRKLPLVEVK